MSLENALKTKQRMLEAQERAVAKERVRKAKIAKTFDKDVLNLHARYHREIAKAASEGKASGIFTLAPDYLPGGDYEEVFSRVKTLLIEEGFSVKFFKNHLSLFIKNKIAISWTHEQ